MRKFTVLLLRPDLIADEFGHDTYLAHVEGSSPSLAQAKAQMEAWVQDNGGPDNVEDDAPGGPDYYHVLCVFEGHLDDLATGETSDDEGSACPTCGADGGTSCGAINCGLLT